ncbi:MAG: type II toxin-antitoxin system HicB family antitoxin [Nitrospirae bacterium]|jgi:predicted RNase H-like HicB family nuclease|nr:type II toxin-antitoxin system HicB family antitoxin [Nitrospirota bacterium]
MKDHYTFEVFWSEEDKGFIAFVHELEGCSAWGETRETALREVETAIELWIEAAREIGRSIPLPNPPVLSIP